MTESKMPDVTNLFAGDQRCVSLLNAIVKTIHERGIGISGPAVLGVIDLVKDQIKMDLIND